MKHSTIKTKLALFCLVALGFTACTKEELKPMLDVQLTIEETDQFEYVEVAFNQLFFYHTDDSRSNLQNKNDRTISGFILNADYTQQLTLQPHFEMEIEAIRLDADILLPIGNEGAIQKVSDYVGDGKIVLEQPVTLLPDNTYKLDITMNTEEVLVIEDNTVKMDWSKANVEVVRL